MTVIVHMVGEEDGKLPVGEVPSVRTRCGRTIDHPVVAANVGPTRYDLVASNGNQFFCATRAQFVTCLKCKNLLGAPHASRPANAQKRTVAHAAVAAARATRPHGRPSA